NFHYLQIRKTNCKNCVIWAKSDDIGRDLIKLSKDVMVGYIVMMDWSTGRRMELVRIEGAKVAGVYYPLIHEKLMKVMHSTEMIEKCMHGLLTIATP
uniref:Uncharacterized protein n=1 Tax=Aegilops tauschii subsp. strangulata TaxID=200361 RepID=A0A453HH76_AEGTS